MEMEILPAFFNLPGFSGHTKLLSLAEKKYIG
jgi:hypothetical protein